MAISSAINKEPVSGASATKVNKKFEVIVIPVADVGSLESVLHKAWVEAYGPRGQAFARFQQQ